MCCSRTFKTYKSVSRHVTKTLFVCLENPNCGFGMARFFSNFELDSAAEFAESFDTMSNKSGVMGIL